MYFMAAISNFSNTSLYFCRIEQTKLPSNKTSLNRTYSAASGTQPKPRIKQRAVLLAPSLVFLFFLVWKASKLEP